MKRYVAAIDQGTTSTRCILFDHAGGIVALDRKEHGQIFPRPGWVEHDAVEIWSATLGVLRGALARAGARAADLAAIGITNQRETTVVWDRATGRPYANAIVWQDTRTDALCRELAEQGGQDRFRATTGLPLATYFSGPKLRWLLDHVRGLRRAAERGDALFGTVDTWLIWNLTGGPRGGVHVTDVSNASRTQLLDLQRLDWDPAILDVLEVPHRMLPEIRPSSDPRLYGMTSPETGLDAPVPVAGALGDQQAALFGQACLRAGEAKNTYGTGCFLLLNTGPRPVRSTSGLITTVAYRIGETPAVFALEGSVAVAGALVQWLRDNLGLIAASSEIEALAASVDDSGGVYLVPAFSGLFAPYWRADARGVIVGLTAYANKGHLARAALEATAYQTRDVLDAMRLDVPEALSELRVDGGMVVNDALMRFQADLLGLPVVRPRVIETTALGAAYAAGLAVGFWQDEDELRAHWREERRFVPTMDAERRERLYRDWRRAVERSLDWA